MQCDDDDGYTETFWQMKKNKENDCIVIEMKNKRFKPSQKYYFVTNHLIRKQ